MAVARLQIRRRDADRRSPAPAHLDALRSEAGAMLDVPDSKSCLQRRFRAAARAFQSPRGVGGFAMTLDALPPSLVFVLMGVFALLLLASSTLGAAMAATHVFGGPSRAIVLPILPELRARLRSWWIIAASFSACLVLGRDMSLAFLALVSFLVLREYLSVTPFGARDRIGLFVAYAMIPLQYGWIARGHAGAAAIVPIAALATLGCVAA